MVPRENSLNDASGKTSLKFSLACCITDQLSSVQFKCFASSIFFFFFFALLYGGCASAELLKLILNETSPTFSRVSNPLIWKAHEVAVCLR